MMMEDDLRGGVEIRGSEIVQAPRVYSASLSLTLIADISANNI
jgi:hypothetical protein